MKLLDVLISLLIPGVIFFHLIAAPYTKVEESFNIQATHDIYYYGTNFTNGLSSTISPAYDHFHFPGAVPRTFVGALILTEFSRPVIAWAGSEHAQFIIRGVLGLVNALALLSFKSDLSRAFGQNVGRWFVLLQASQFHVIYYASRTLPNTYAFALTTLAMGQLIPVHGEERQKRQLRGIFMLVFAGVVFRSEIAILLFTELIYLLVASQISFRVTIIAGIASALFALAISIPVDSYFWQRLIWPEFSGFYFNAIEGKSSEWGTEPFGYYFTTALPKLLLNPLILTVLTPLNFLLPSARNNALGLFLPAVSFIFFYSFQPHKEPRFIIYVLPLVTAAASISASYIWTRRTKTLLYGLGSLVMVGSIVATLVTSSVMLFISSLNYPGGEALALFHKHVDEAHVLGTLPPNITVHMDVLSCMTGVTHFGELKHAAHLPPNTTAAAPLRITYDKTENATELLLPAFWAQLDYAIMEDPALVIGRWDLVGWVRSYRGMELLRPGDLALPLAGYSPSGNVSDNAALNAQLAAIYAATNTTSANQIHRIAATSQANRAVQSQGLDLAHRTRLLTAGRLDRAATLYLLRDAVRLATGGWWFGPRVEPNLVIMRNRDRMPAEA